MKCPKCQHENPEDSTFCGKCATNLGNAPQPSFTKTLESPVEIPQGTTFAGKYEILEKLGQGGMGAVYKALDKDLGRQVAIKVLPAEFATDKERMARFEREAKLLAVLNHPNIASIYGLEESEGRRFLVLELVEGETLSTRLDRGSPPVEEALGTFRQIAEGLEAAHEKGIIHRDLKPSNVMITPEDKVKILDFGLAKAYAAETTDIDIEKSPTITAQMTAPGVIMGTAAYMSPEQARSRAVDKRTDIWSFGCVLYECLAGKRAFNGETVSDTLALILKGDPDWAALPANTSPIIKSLLARCLQKDRRNRLHDIADARIEMEEALTSPPSEDQTITAISSKAKWKPRLLWTLVGLVFGSILTGFILWNLKSSKPGMTARALIDLEPAKQLGTQNGYLPHRTSLALSPDGTFLVYSGIEEESSCLFLRRMDDFDARPISGTEGGDIPFLSPDGEWVGFLAEGTLKKVPISGGIPVALCEHPTLSWGVSWGSNDTIIFSDSTSLWRISAAGGAEPEKLTTAERAEGELGHILPHMLPGGDAVLFTIQTSANRYDNPQIALLSLPKGEYKVIVDEGADARYISTGHIVFARRGMLYAIGFDLDKLETYDSSIPLPVEVTQAMNAGMIGINTFAAQFSVSASGSLAYASGGVFPDQIGTLVWWDRKGVEQGLNVSPDPYFAPRISPDGKSIAHTHLGKERDIFVYDIERGTSILLTHGGFNRFPIWTPDGNTITFDVIEGPGRGKIVQLPADGSGERETLISSEYSLAACSWSPDGEVLAFVETNPSTGFDIWVFPKEEGKRVEFACTESNEGWPEFSPTDKWLAYASDETGRYEVYLQPYPPTGRKIPISTQGGRDLAWSQDGHELFFVNSEGLWVVDINTGSDSPGGRARLLIGRESGFYTRGEPSRNFDVSHDDQRFLLPKGIRWWAGNPISEINIVFNWFEELKRLVPSGK